MIAINRFFINNYSLFIKLLHAGIVFLFMYSFGFSAFQGDQVAYLPYTLARFDSTLFSTDYTASVLSTGFTTQFFIDILFIGFMKLGISWVYINGILYFVCLVIFSLGIIQAAHAITDKYQLCIGLFFAFCVQLLTIGQAFGSNSIWLNAFFNQTPAIAISIWAFYFVLIEKPRWMTASIMIAISALFHVQVALYMYLIIAVLMMIYVKNTKEFKPLLSIIPVFVVITSSYFLVSLGSDISLSNQDFTAIYSVLRHPHHLVPSTWSINGMIFFLCYALLLIPFGLLCTDSKNRTSFIKKWLFPTCILFLIAGFNPVAVPLGSSTTPISSFVIIHAFSALIAAVRSNLLSKITLSFWSVTFI